MTIPRFLAPLLGGLIFFIAAVFAFATLFTTYVAWDDEGYFLQAYRAYASGEAPYKSVFSFYGPYSFFLPGLLAGFDAERISHDSMRWATMGLWLATASLLALTVWRWTGNLGATSAVFIAVASRLSGLAKGIGHPQVFVLVLLPLFFFLPLNGSDGKRERTWKAALIGLLTGILLGIKINIGIFVLLAIVPPLVFDLPRGALRLPGFVWAAVTSCLPVWLVLRGGGATFSEWVYVAAFLIPLAAIFTMSWNEGPGVGNIADFFGDFSAGLGIAVLAAVVGTVWAGASVRDIVNGVIIEPVRLTEAYKNVYGEAASRKTLVLLGANLMTLWGLAQARRLPRPRFERAVFQVKSLAGCALLLALYFYPRYALCGALSFLWLLPYAPHAGVDGQRKRRFLALLALFYSAQLFPMAGEQVDWATLLPVAAAGVLLADGLAGLRQLGHSRIQAMPAMAALALFCALSISAAEEMKRWLGRTSLGLPGAAWMRLSPEEGEELRNAVSGLARNCKSALSIPGQYSLSVWSGVPFTERPKINAWPFLIPRQNVLDLAQRNDCVLVHAPAYEFYRGFARRKEEGSLIDEVARGKHPAFQNGSISIYLSGR